MTWKARFALFFGLLGMACLAAGLLVYVDAAQSAIHSDKAQLSARSYTIGTDYTGIITEQYVQEGDDVTAHQTLFTIKSSALTEQLKSGKVKPDDLLYPLTPQGEILLQAPKAGVITDIQYGQGSFVSANKEIATMVDDSTVSVKATYRLSHKDFARLSKSTRIEVHLPDGSYANGTASSIDVLSQSDVVETQIEAKLDGVSGNHSALAPGTPVSTTLHLKEHTYWDQIKAYVGKFL